MSQNKQESSILKKLVNLVLYGNYWIAFCALAMFWQSRLVLGQGIKLDHLAGFVFFATLFVYAAHRIVGISRLKDFFEVDRYNVIASFKWHIFLYASISAIGGFYCFLYLAFPIQLALIIPGIFSLAYVVPIIGKQKRLRDVNHIKIYLIAAVWAFATVSLPAMETQEATTLPVLLMTLERGIFIFLITLPFDIRDLKVDTFNQVKTLPAQLGLENTVRLGYVMTAVFVIFVLLNFQLGTYQLSDVLALSISALSTAWFLSKSSPNQHDYFYSGLMDGTMIFQFVLVCLGRYFVA